MVEFISVSFLILLWHSMNRKGLNGLIYFFQRKIFNFSLKKINQSKKLSSNTPFCEAKQ